MGESPEQRITRTLHHQGREAAIALCRDWLANTRRPAIRVQREALCRKLGLLELVPDDQAREEARRATLYACAMHVFDTSGIELVASKIPHRLTCVMCKAWMPTLEAAAYARGFAAAGGDPQTVIEGFGS